jgi:hypothetical protein
MPYPKGDMSMKSPGKSMRDMMGMGKPSGKPTMPMKGKTAGKKMTMGQKMAMGMKMPMGMKHGKNG